MRYGAGGLQRLCYKDMFTCACKYTMHVQEREEGKRTKSAEGALNSVACCGGLGCGAKVGRIRHFRMCCILAKTEKILRAELYINATPTQPTLSKSPPPPLHVQSIQKLCALSKSRLLSKLRLVSKRCG